MRGSLVIFLIMILGLVVFSEVSSLTNLFAANKGEPETEYQKLRKELMDRERAGQPKLGSTE